MIRKILRNRARLNMHRVGLKQINKRPLVKDPISGRVEKADSYFADYWRNYAAIIPTYRKHVTH